MHTGLKMLLSDVACLTLLSNTVQLTMTRSTNYQTICCNTFSIILSYFKHQLSIKI